MKSHLPTRPTDLPADEYARHRAEVIGLLRARFGSALNDSDREDLYHEAWAGVLDFERREGSAPDVLGLLKTVAWRRARDQLRNRSAVPSDPLEGVLALVFDGAPSPEERVQQRVEADTCRRLIEELSERERRVLRLRLEWELSPAEIQATLGVSKKSYEKTLTRALKRLTAALADEDTGLARERALALLLACDAGTASSTDRERARRLISSDPTSRAILRRIRGAAGLFPAPLILVAARRALGHLGAGRQALGAHVRRTLAGVTRGAHALGGHACGGATRAILVSKSAVACAAAVTAAAAASVAYTTHPGHSTARRTGARAQASAHQLPAPRVASGAERRPIAARPAIAKRKPRSISGVPLPGGAQPAPAVVRAATQPSVPPAVDASSRTVIVRAPQVTRLRAGGRAGDGSAEFGP